MKQLQAKHRLLYIFTVKRYYKLRNFHIFPEYEHIGHAIGDVTAMSVINGNVSTLKYPDYRYYLEMTFLTLHGGSQMAVASWIN